MLIASLKRRLHDGIMKDASPPDECLTTPMQGLLGYQLRRAWLAMGADLGKRLEDLSLTGMSLSVLLMIEANPGVSQSELARHMDVKRANMTPITAQFADRGLIERKATDGRSHGLLLTSAGRDLARLAWECVAANERRFLSRLSESEQAEARRILIALRQQQPD
jgi:DNA-binding MarR family transcriptional regulator